ncbi:MAG: hypothetical protein LBL43_06795 [Treponema sp.]|jgi:uncharacterized protein YdeI (BOF family)|nr:hypothetical protein [Treponema sp.]
MNKRTILLVAGILLFSAGLYAQSGANSQDSQTGYFGGGGYSGTVLSPIGIADLLQAEPNEYVIVQGFLVQQRVPGTFVLADSASDPATSVVVHLNAYDWANLQIDAATPILVYGIVSKSNLSIEIVGDRVEIQK